RPRPALNVVRCRGRRSGSVRFGGRAVDSGRPGCLRHPGVARGAGESCRCVARRIRIMTVSSTRKRGMVVSFHRPVIALIAMIIVLVSARSAYALSCKSALFTLSEAYEAADSISAELVTECEEEVSSDSWASGGDGCSFVGLEVLKHAVPPRDYGGVVSSSGCGLFVNVGSQYLLFLDSENRPMSFSAPLAGDHYLIQPTRQYLRILRDFRNGYVNDLAEPWLHYEYGGDCAIRQSIAGHQISFSRHMPDAP